MPAQGPGGSVRQGNPVALGAGEEALAGRQVELPAPGAAGFAGKARASQPAANALRVNVAFDELYDLLLKPAGPTGLVGSQAEQVANESQSQLRTVFVRQEQEGAMRIRQGQQQICDVEYENGGRGVRLLEGLVHTRWAGSSQGR